MSQYDFDLLTIGGGSGGVRASRWAASLGAKVAICEESRYGGTCVLRGCIPKKLMLLGSEFPHFVKYSTDYGWSIKNYSLDWMAQKTARDKELSRLEGIYENLLAQKGVMVLKGHGKIVAPHTVEVGGKKYSAKNILITVGSKPSLIDTPGAQLAISSDDVFNMEECPSSILVLGGGYIGLEFAGIFNGFGSQVSLVFRKDIPLSGFDKEVGSFLKEEMLKKGIEIFSNSTIESMTKKDNSFEVKLSTGQTKKVDKVLLAIGREPKTQNLGIESLGIKTNDHGEIEVNKYFETSVKNVYALGDCANTPYQLTPVATAEGMLLAEYLFAGSKQTMDYHLIPTAIFSTPSVATVGLTEEQVKASGKEYSIYSSRFRPLKYTVTSLEEKTFMKMIVDKKTDEVLGVHMVGDSAAEIMQGIAVALKTGAKKSDFDKTIGIHPTSAEELFTMRS